MNTKREKEFLIIEILKKGIDFVFCNSHAKILSVKTENNYYNLSGSMNSGSNQKIENLHISNSKPIFEFIKSTYFELKNKCTIKPRHDGIQ